MNKRIATAMPPVFILLVALGFFAWIGWDRTPSGSAALDKTITATAKRGPLEVFVESAGTINSRDSYKLVANNKTKAALEFAIEEGSRVTPGDLLLKINNEKLEDLILATTEAAAEDELLISDRETGLEIQTIEAKTNFETSTNALQAARMNYQKFMSAEQPQKIREAELALRTSESDVVRHAKRMEELVHLLQKEFVTESEVEEQQLLYDKALVDRDGATLELAALKTFELPVTLQELTNKIDQAALNLRKAEVSGRTKVALAKRALKKAQDDWERSKEKLAELIEQRSAYEYTSPVGGIVFYGDTGVSAYRRIRTLEVGEDVSPGQVLMTIPIDSAMKAEIQITEADIQKVAVGQKAEVRVDAVSGKVFEGDVEKVAEAASDQGYFASGIKEFAVKVAIKNNAELRQGFSCHVRILIEKREDVVQIPVQGVFKEEDSFYVFRPDGTRQAVEIGASSLTHVEIKKGLAAGEAILLVRPTT